MPIALHSHYIAPSNGALSYGFPSVHPVVASVLLPLNGALPNLLPTVSCPSTMSTLPSRSLPTGLSPSYFQAISTLSTPSVLVPSFLPSFPSFLPYFLPLFPLSFLPSFPLVPSFLPCSSGSSVSLPSRQSKLNENPSIGDAFGKKLINTD